MNNLANITFSEEDIAELTALLEQHEQKTILCKKEMSGIWLHSEDWETELRLLLLFHYRLTVSRVCFVNRRRGTMTAVLNWMIHFCQQHEIQSILVQSVETPEMASWCIKNGFKPNPNASFFTGNMIIGDYQREIENSI